MSKLPVGSLVLMVDGPYQVIEIMTLGPVRPPVRWEDLEIWSSRSPSFSLPAPGQLETWGRKGVVSWEAWGNLWSSVTAPKCLPNTALLSPALLLDCFSRSPAQQWQPSPFSAIFCLFILGLKMGSYKGGARRGWGAAEPDHGICILGLVLCRTGRSRP